MPNDVVSYRDLDQRLSKASISKTRTTTFLDVPADDFPLKIERDLWEPCRHESRIIRRVPFPLQENLIISDSVHLSALFPLSFFLYPFPSRPDLDADRADAAVGVKRDRDHLSDGSVRFGVYHLFKCRHIPPFAFGSWNGRVRPFVLSLINQSFLAFTLVSFLCRLPRDLHKRTLFRSVIADRQRAFETGFFESF